MGKKQCFKCGEVKQLSEFYKHPRMADGHVNKCKECNKKDVRENRSRKTAYYREYDKSRNSNIARLIARRRYLHDHPEVKKRAMERYQDKYPEKRIAHVIAGNAIRDSRLIKKPCEVCGEIDGVEAHHEDYSKPLEVTWLCREHHLERHGKKRRWEYKYINQLSQRHIQMDLF